MAGAITIREMKQQINHIQELMKEVMIENQHYGKIPGCGDKPALLKAGAEKLTFSFQISPKFNETITDLGGDHKEYSYVASLSSRTGIFLGDGIGSCSTKESKYRYRNAPDEATDIPVPGRYWSLRKESPDEAQKLLGGKNFGTVKVENQWFISKKSGGKSEHDNPADYYNTCRKMGKKRALVDAILTVTAASDIFAQDIDDSPELFEKPQPTPPPKKEAQPTQPKRQSNGAIVMEKINEWLDSGDVPNNLRETVIKELLVKTIGKDTLKGITNDEKAKLTDKLTMNELLDIAQDHMAIPGDKDVPKNQTDLLGDGPDDVPFED